MKAPSVALQIKIYTAKRILESSFETSSGKLKEKEILQLLFFEKQQPVFIHELPLSPSLGEMPNDIKIALKQHHTKALFRSTHLRRSLSWLNMKTTDFTSFQKKKPINTLSLQTFGIGDWPVTNRLSVVKIKSDLKSIKQLIAFSKNSTNRWCVDFNGSLSEEAWTYLIKNANFDNCLWVEQPFPCSKLTFKLANQSPVSIYADEEISRLSPATFKSSPYTGFILKTIKHDFSVFLEWLTFAQNNEIPCIIGTQVCDEVSSSLCRFFNQFSTICVDYTSLASFFIGANLNEEIFTLKEGFVNINSKVFEFVEDNYSLLFVAEI